MKYLFLIGFIFLSLCSLKAQSDFRNGYIINKNNDTIHGLIDYKGNKASARICSYREDVNAETQSFTPDEIKGYRFIDSKYYISMLVNNGIEKKQIFIEYLINGIVDIYYYRDDHGEHYLIDDGNNKLYELKNEEKEVMVNGTRYMKESKEYIGLLKAVFKDSPTTNKKIENINLNHKSLITITNDYHNEVCVDKECIIYEKKLPKTKNTYGLVIGLNGMSFSGTSEFTKKYYYMRNSDFGFEIFPSIGLYYKVNMPFVNERLYFQYEGTYSRVTLTTSNTYIEPTYNMNVFNDITLTQNAFNNLTVIKYEFPKGKIRPTFQIGGYVNFFLKAEYNRNQVVKYSWGETYYTNQAKDNPFAKNELGVNCGVGIKSIYHKGKELYLDLRYQRGIGILQEMKTNTVSLNLGVQIGK